jgi:dolichyl-phosphate beta-glucosyltransferase
LAAQLAQGSVIGYVDADNKTPIEEFEKLAPFLREGWDVVIGSRRLPEASIERPQPWYRKMGAKGFYYFMHALVELPDIGDTQCGFKFFSRRAALDLFSRQKIDGYMFDVEILCLAQAAGYRIAEVPIRWRDDGDSRLDLLSGNLRNMADILRIRSTQGSSRRKG